MKRWMPMVFVGLWIGGCATIRNGEAKPVSFTSEPSGAVIVYKGVEVGTTPTTIDIERRGRDKRLSFTLPGYKTVVLVLDRQTDPKTFFGGLTGLTIDAITGRAGTYADELHITLEEGVGEVEIHSKDIEARIKTAQTVAPDPIEP